MGRSGVGFSVSMRDRPLEGMVTSLVISLFAYCLCVDVHVDLHSPSSCLQLRLHFGCFIFVHAFRSTHMS